MNKKQKSFVAIFVIAFVLYNVLFFAIPLRKIAASWVMYVFSLVAIILSACITAYAFGKEDSNLKSKIYGYPIFKIGMVYVAVQILLGAVIGLIGAFVHVPAWIAVVIAVVLLGLALAGVIATDNIRDVIEEQEEVLERQTKTVTYFRMNMESVIDFCEDEELRKKLVNLSEKFRYSDPVSCDELEEIEQKITEEIEVLKNLVTSDVDEASKKIVYIENLLADRNRRCKALKK